MTWLREARARFHARCLSGPITETRGVPSVADVSNTSSREIAKAMVAKIGPLISHAEKPAGQTAGSLFEAACQDFIAECFEQFTHLRPGRFSVERGQQISRYAQYAHLDELRALADASRTLKTHLGTDYLIKPDVVVVRGAETDAVINQSGDLVDASVARHSGLRQANGARATLHASISCKLTIRSDRVQNPRSEALNLIRNRKGRLPHIVAVTAEPVPSRIAAIALGTGDMDCVYHFALLELVETMREQERDALELVETMIDGQRLRDISDLPLDLVV
ncbi:NgoMIV family type II restriction endonuclease [Falsiruegeria mediterranea]|uniref:Type-2 restriction enzyme NgoMIV n=1 Tax=Falsiruegeria mediterranea M17 TaxID=1200281 RepID=A0A2R8CF51_9RHOB|nr:NgoMIV family type II restriction endonuclease [Falsiruegeria mediterranea]SPJ31061.1 Type-2 restriction enzyme NgoMIV [Falsiruegeria mediterranea M17]